MVLESWLQHLHTDFEQAFRRLKTEEYQPDKTPNTPMPEGETEADDNVEENIAQVEGFLHGDRLTLESVSGIPAAQLPPASMMQEPQAEELVEVMVAFMDEFHYKAEFPSEMPYLLRYKLLRTLWSEHTVPAYFWENRNTISNGMFVMDFCSGNAPECELGSYCPCLKYLDEG